MAVFVAETNREVKERQPRTLTQEDQRLDAARDRNGPIWFPVNYLIMESLQKFHHYLGRLYGNVMLYFRRVFA